MDLLHASLPSSPSIRVFNAAIDAVCAENGQVIVLVKSVF